MRKRLIPFLLLLVGLLHLSGEQAFAQAKMESFIIVSVTYKDANNKDQTVPFDMTTKTAPVPGVAVNNDIIINGTYNPANAVVVSTIKVREGVDTKDSVTPGCSVESIGTVKASNGL